MTPQTHAYPVPASALAAGEQRRAKRHWLRAFFTGLALWVATVIVTFLTRNANLIPAIILVGSFLVPVTFVIYAFQRADQVVTAQRILTAFVYGGLLGVLGASVLEAALLRGPSVTGFAGVGLIEEAVKVAALWLLARRLPRYTARDGMVLGAAVGFGFAAFESAGYAFNALFTSRGLSLFSLLETEVLRGLLAPVGHGLWTALVGGALFAVAGRRGRLRLGGSVIGWYAVAAVLHWLWDASNGIAGWLTLLLTGAPAQWLMVEMGKVPPFTPAQLDLYTILTWGLMGVDAVIGVLILVVRWRRAVPRVPVAQAMAPTQWPPVFPAALAPVGIERPGR
jgi:RsiW-degrading membrane proteinase PrsW (M82 family)